MQKYVVFVVVIIACLLTVCGQLLISLLPKLLQLIGFNMASLYSQDYSTASIGIRELMQFQLPKSQFIFAEACACLREIHEIVTCGKLIRHLSLSVFTAY